MKHLPINLENYEEYFLLYVDNELTEGQKKDLAVFIEEYPELKEELTMLMNTRLKPEEIRMALKHELYRSEESHIINELNYESYQLLLIDHELDEKEAKAIEAFTKNNPEAASNLEWLNKARLPLEEISFPDKSLLYRSTEKPALIIPIKWYRMAVAAAILLAAGLWFMNRQDEEEPIPSSKITVAQQLPAGETKQATGEPSPVNGDKVQIMETVTDAAGRNLQENKVLPDISAVKTTVRADNRQDSKSIENSSGTEIENKNIAEETAPRNTIEDVVVVGSDPMLPTNEFTAQTAAVLNVKSNYASDALNRDNSSSVPDQIINIDEEKPRKGMFRGIVRKANRLYNKVTNPDLDRPMVRVANIEIGIPR